MKVNNTHPPGRSYSCYVQYGASLLISRVLPALRQVGGGVSQGNWRRAPELT
jgi:hypothetical protein